MASRCVGFLPYLPNGILPAPLSSRRPRVTGKLLLLRRLELSMSELFDTPHCPCSCRPQALPRIESKVTWRDIVGEPGRR